MRLQNETRPLTNLVHFAARLEDGRHLALQTFLQPQKGTEKIVTPNATPSTWEVAHQCKTTCESSTETRTCTHT
jgi:hypothetical protein